ncbi:MAG: hypothetical protein KF895_02510 [Parvibaculum sp.]|nr:hypothetical protein [Parvibaculaceae bacterium]MBX3504324.1 hypothetical protein [Parvibaculum sp.]
MNFGIAMIWGVAIGSVFGVAIDNIPLGVGVGSAMGAAYALFFHRR